MLHLLWPRTARFLFGRALSWADDKLSRLCFASEGRIKMGQKFGLLSWGINLRFASSIWVDLVWFGLVWFGLVWFVICAHHPLPAQSNSNPLAQMDEIDMIRYDTIW